MLTPSLILSWPRSALVRPGNVGILAGAPLPASVVGPSLLPCLLGHNIVAHVDVFVHDLIKVPIFQFGGLLASLAMRQQVGWTLVLVLALGQLIVSQVLPFILTLISHCEICNLCAF